MVGAVVPWTELVADPKDDLFICCVGPRREGVRDVDQAEPCAGAGFSMEGPRIMEHPD